MSYRNSFSSYKAINCKNIDSSDHSVSMFVYKTDTDQSQHCICKKLAEKLEHVLFRPTISANQKVGRFIMIHNRFFSADSIGRQNRAIFIVRLRPALRYRMS